MTARRLHGVVATAYVALLVHLLIWLLYLAPPDGALLSIALLTLVGPLLIPLRGVLYGRRHAVAWSAIVVLIYFIHGVTHIAAPGVERWLGAIEIALVVIHFTAAMRFIQHSIRQERRSPADSS